jgi:hypothetical protein
MKVKSLLILMAAAAVAIVAALWITSERPPETAQLNTPLLPSLADSINRVTGFRIIKAGNETVATLQRGEQSWTVAERYNYPADMNKVRGLLLGLANARRREEKTQDPGYYERLGVADVNAANASGVRVELEGLAAPLAVIIGNSDSQGGNGTFVRLPGEAQSWLVSGNLTVAKEASQWLEPKIMDIPAERIQQITLRRPQGETLTVSKEQRAQTNFMVQSVPAGRELKSASIANSLATELSALQLEDVLPATAVQELSQPVTEADYRTFDGLNILARAVAKDGKYYAHFSIDFEAAQAQRFAPTEAPTAGQDGAKAEAAKPDTATDTVEARRKEAEQLNSRLSPWVYAIAEFRYENLNKGLEDLLKPVASKPEEKTQEAPSGAAKAPTPEAEEAPPSDSEETPQTGSEEESLPGAEEEDESDLLMEPEPAPIDEPQGQSEEAPQEPQTPRR